MQTAVHLSGGTFHTLELPSPCDVAQGATLWGRHDELCSPAYWVAQAWMWEMEEPLHYRLGESLEEELIACLLGGYGIPAEVGLAAFDRLRPHLGDPGAPLRSEEAVRALLLEPLVVDGRLTRYRFANQKARRVSAALTQLDEVDRETGDRDLRQQLLALEGVGPKTASWIVRNLRCSDEVAILDTHILRAGCMLGIFPPMLTVERHYLWLEAAFLEFARAIGVRPSMLDSVIWMCMRRLPAGMLDGMAGRPDAAYRAERKHQPRANARLEA